MIEYSVSDLYSKCINIKYQSVGEKTNYAFEEDNDTLFIYFEGSEQGADWKKNFMFKKRPYKDMKIPYKVHRGFLSAWKSVEDIIGEKISEKIGEDYKYKHIVIIGFSHGGALSGFCHEYVWFHRPDLRGSGLLGIGFESPRFFGSFHMKKKLKERWTNYYVTRNHTDIVTHVPPKLFRFTHVGPMYKVGKKAKTGRIESHLPHNVVKSLEGLTIGFEGGIRDIRSKDLA